MPWWFWLLLLLFFVLIGVFIYLRNQRPEED